MASTKRAAFCGPLRKFNRDRGLTLITGARCWWTRLDECDRAVHAHGALDAPDQIPTGSHRGADGLRGEVLACAGTMRPGVYW